MLKLEKPIKKERPPEKVAFLDKKLWVQLIPKCKLRRQPPGAWT